uniref:VWFA domain-containing protein n=1 Tax=Syphacia muris TaxID=451379 RepID=A0A0N5B167_9BILA
MVESLNIGPGSSDSRVGFVTFDNIARLGFHLDTYFTKSQLFVTRARRNVLKIMVVVTNGKDWSNVGEMQKLADEENIVVYAIGATDGVDMADLIRVTGNASRVFTGKNFGDLADTMRTVCKETAGPTQQPHFVGKSCGCDDYHKLFKHEYWLDIVYAVDTTDAISYEKFNSIKRNLALLTMVNVGINPTGQYSRMAIINIGQNVQIFTNLTNAFQSRDYRNYIMDNLKQMNGSNATIHDAMIAAKNMFEEEARAKRRENVRKVVVLFTARDVECEKRKIIKSKYDSDETRLCQAIVDMKKAGITFVVVTYRKAGTEDYPVVDIAPSCNIIQDSFETISDILRCLCRANCFCTRDFVQFDRHGDECEKYAECYRTNPMPLPKDAAKYVCENVNGVIPNVYSQEKDDFLKELHIAAKRVPFWIGNECPNGNCVDIPEATNGTLYYQNWCNNRGQPKFNDGGCIYVNQCSGLKSGWFSAECDDIITEKFFTCEVDACSVNKYCPVSN